MAAVDVLFGSFDPEKVKAYFENNAKGLLTKVTAVVESNKHLLIYQSQADPYTVFLKIVNTEGFLIDDIILLVCMVIVFGRSLKSLNKQAEGEAGKAFRNNCMKYRIMYNYNKKKMEGEARRFTTKCEHVFAAFPFLASVCQAHLVSQGLINIITPFTQRGIDFQSSTALNLWKDPMSFGMQIFLAELKNQCYIAKRTQGVDYQAMSKRVIYKPTGEEMTQQQARDRQAIDSRSYTVLGMCSPDLIVKLLWACNINCPPFKAKPAYLYIAEAGNAAAKAIQVVVSPIQGEEFDNSKLRCVALANQSGITAQFNGLKRENAVPEEILDIGMTKFDFGAKCYLFIKIARALNVPPDRVKSVFAHIGVDDIDASELLKVPADDDIFANKAEAYDALIAHLKGL